MSKRLRVADLFAGAGGLSLGLKQAGIDTVYAADAWQPAIATYSANLGHPAVHVSIDQKIKLPECDIIVGGPPCQSFSSAGARRSDDPRGNLVSVFASIVARARPAAFLFENVEGFLTAGNGARVFDLLTPLVSSGYRIHLRKINAANYGVPQHRKRVIAIGALGWDPSFPLPTHRAHGAPGASRTGSRELPQTPSIADAFRGLPIPDVNPPGKPEDHYTKSLDNDDLERIRALGPGMTMKDLPSELWHPSYRRRAFRRVMDGTPSERRGGAPAGLRRLRNDEPAKAITSGARTEFVHPTEDRLLTLRECARLQTFPDTFEFSGSQSDRALLIGNAIPPMLGQVLGFSLLRDFSVASSRSYTNQGALLSFMPTSSEGASPVLARLISAVEERFGLTRTQLSLIS